MKYVAIGLVCLFGILLLVPMGMMVSGSLMGNVEGAGRLFRVFPRSPTLDNYRTLLKYPIGRWFFNSTFIAVVSVGGSILVAVATAFGVAKYTFRGRGLVLAAIVLSILTPGYILTIPKFVVVAQLGLFDTYWAMILPGLFAAGSVWFLVKFMNAIPNDLIGMGRIDGLGAFGLLRHVIIPMSTPAIAALAALGVVGAWAEYMWPLLVLHSPELMVLPVGIHEVAFVEWLQDQVRGLRSMHGGIPLAGAVITTAPGLILFLFTQKFFVGGLFSKKTGGE